MSAEVKQRIVECGTGGNEGVMGVVEEVAVVLVVMLAGVGESAVVSRIALRRDSAREGHGLL